MIAAAITFELLKERFLAGLDRRVSHLTSCMAVLDNSEGSGKATDRDEIVRALHSLAGIGGTYGYSAITRTARAAEVLSASLSEELRATELTSLRYALDAVITAASAAAKDDATAFVPLMPVASRNHGQERHDLAHA